MAGRLIMTIRPRERYDMFLLLKHFCKITQYQHESTSRVAKTYVHTLINAHVLSELLHHPYYMFMSYDTAISQYNAKNSKLAVY